MDQYDSFVVLGDYRKDNHGHVYWKVKCQICGYETWFVKSKLKTPLNCKQCSSSSRRYKPEDYTHQLFQTYQGMIQRCTNPRSKDYKNYGGRGVYVCEEWLMSFAQFVEDMGDRPAGMTLDRIDRNGPYTKENCRWASLSVQNKNKRTNYRSKLEKVFKV